MIKRVGTKRYVVMTSDGSKKLTKPLPRAAAVKRMKQIEYYKQGA
jgi:hypothetical protein